MADTQTTTETDDTPTVDDRGRINLQLPGGIAPSFSQGAQKMILVSMTITVLVAMIETVHKAAPPPPGTTGTASIPAGTIQGSIPQSVTAKGAGSTAGDIAKILAGGFIATALLLALSYFLPEFASGLAIVALAVTIFERGTPFWTVVTRITKPAAAA